MKNRLELAADAILRRDAERRRDQSASFDPIAVEAKRKIAAQRTQQRRSLKRTKLYDEFKKSSLRFTMTFMEYVKICGQEQHNAKTDLDLMNL